MATKDFPYISITQPVGTFFLCVVNALELMSMVDILRRGLSEEERRNVQRKLNVRRAGEIADFISDPDATFPTSIIVSAYPDSVTVDENRRCLTFDMSKPVGEVIDGQHRLEGIKRAIAQGKTPLLDEFQLPVVFMLDLLPDDKAYIFTVINSKQTPMQSSLIFDLFGLRQTRGPRKVCHEIAEVFNGDPEGPFYRGLKMLGTKNFDSEMITQGAFVKYTLTLLSKTPDEDETRLKMHQPLDREQDGPFRELFVDRKDELVAKILKNYFSAMRKAFPKEWDENPKAYLLRKTAGFSAMIIIFKRLWSQLEGRPKDVSFEAFYKFAQEMKERAGTWELTSANFGSSEQGAKKLADLLLDGKQPNQA